LPLFFFSVHFLSLFPFPFAPRSLFYCVFFIDVVWFGVFSFCGFGGGGVWSCVQRELRERKYDECRDGSVLWKVS